MAHPSCASSSHGLASEWSLPYLALTPAMAGVGRCHKNFRQVLAGARQFGRGTWKHTHTDTDTDRHNPQTYM